MQKGSDPDSLYRLLVKAIKTEVGRREAETALRKSDARYESILRVAPIALCNFIIPQETLDVKSLPTGKSLRVQKLKASAMVERRWSFWKKKVSNCW